MKKFKILKNHFNYRSSTFVLFIFLLLTNSIIIQAQQISAGADQTICTDSCRLQADAILVPFGEIIWSQVSGKGKIIQPNQADTWVTGLETGKNVFRLTVTSNHRIYTDEINVFNYSVYANAGIDLGLCTDRIEFIAVTYNDINNYGSWSAKSDSNQLVNNPQKENVWKFNLKPGKNTFTWKVNNGICLASDDVNVFDYLPQRKFAGIDQVVYEDNALLEAEESKGKWQIIEAGTNTQIQTADNPLAKVTQLKEGDNYFRWVVSSKYCNNADTVKITYYSGTAPYIKDIPDYFTESLTGFDIIELDKYVYDDNTRSSDIQWKVTGGENIRIRLRKNMAYIESKSKNWQGSESLIFTATDKSGYSTSDAVKFTIGNVMGNNLIPSQLNIYPNPNEGLFDLKFVSSQSQKLAIQIFNLKGQLKYSTGYENYPGLIQAKIDLRDYGKGIYFVRIITDTEIVTKKVIFE